MVYLPTGSVTKERSVFFDLKYLGKLTDMIENEQLNGETEIKVAAVEMCAWMS